MEVRAVYVRLSMTLLVSVAHVQQSYPQTAHPDFYIVPSKLQLFAYESVSFTCEGIIDSAGWKLKNNKGTIPTCVNGTATSTVTCSLLYAFETDSGEYWCEGGRGERSNTVNITITLGSVILESPVLPVMEGDDVTLSCRKKETSSNLPADFYKDGVVFGSSPTGNLTIESVSKSNDGLYRCSISGSGESPESRLTVRGKGGSVILGSSALPVTEAIPKDSNTQHAVRTGSSRVIRFPVHYFILLWVAVTSVLVLQLLVIGLLCWKKQLVLLEVKLSDPNKDLYAVIRKDKKKERKKDAEDAADNLSFCFETNPQTEPESGVSTFIDAAFPTAPTDVCSTEPEPQYSTIHWVTEDRE